MSVRRRLLYCMNKFDANGAERGFIFLCKSGLCDVAEIHACALARGDGRLTPDLESLAELASWRFLSSSKSLTGLGLLQSAFRLRRLIREIRPDVIVLSLPQTNLIGRPIAKWLGVRKVIAFVHSVGLRRQHLSVLLKLTSPFVDAVMFDTASTWNATAETFIGRERLHQLRMPLYVAPDQPPAPRRSWEGRVPVVAMIGQLYEKKNHAGAITAIKLLRDRGIALKLRIAGDGQNRDTLVKLARDLGVADQVDFLGYVQGPRSLRQEADIFLQASVTEGLAIATLEAMADAMPVVATPVGGVLDYGEADHTMQICADASAPSIADALAAMIGDPRRAIAIGQNAAASTRARFSAQQVRGQLELLRQFVDS